MISTDLMIIDGATPFLKYMAATKPDWMRKSLKSFGWFSQQQIKAGIRSGAPGGQSYPASVPEGIRNALRNYYGGKDKKRYPPLGKLVNAVGYQYKEDYVVVGWLSQSAVLLGEKIEAGSQKTVSKKMQKFFFASGVPLVEGTIDVAPRKTFGPMQNVLAPKASEYIEGKIIEYMNGAQTGKATTRRKYQVMG